MAAVTVKGGDKDYAPRILGLVETIKSNPVGRVIVEGVESSSKLLTIRPESERPKGSFDPNLTYTGSVAATFPVDSAGKPDYAGAAPAALSREGKDLRDKWYQGRGDDEETEDIDERYQLAPDRWGKPRGSGSHAALYFTPGGKNDTACSRGHGTCAEQDDEILMHELVHALRYMQGVFNAVPTTGRYKNEEEFLALVVTNVYMSKKKGNKLLRPDYERVGPLQPPWNTSEGFLKNDENRRILEHYATAWQPIFGRLGDVDTPFNPFRPFKTSRKP
jgi:hypothetical protein